jgi:DnaJ-class molecular chaperone
MDKTITPITRKTIKGEGFCNPDEEDYLTSTLREKKPEVRGNLIVTFDIIFPENLSANKKEQLKKILPP